jgi:opacity protein-like surface antigen
MKKILFVAATLLALISTSCSNNGGIDVNDPKEYCWTLSVSVSVLGQSETVSENVWATGEDLKEGVDAAKEEMEAMKSMYQSLGVSMDYSINTAKNNITSEEACYDYRD